MDKASEALTLQLFQFAYGSIIIEDALINNAYGADKSRQLSKDTMNISGAIFDMDGVVVDNHQYHFMAWMQFAKKYRYELSEEIYRDRFNGKTNADLFRMIFGDISQDTIDAYTKEKEDLYQEIYFPELRATTGLVEFLEDLNRRKIKVALGTSAPTRNVDFVLDNLKLRQYFPVIVDGAMVTKGKPDPEVYLLCARKLGLEPQKCVVFEDSLAGLDSGSAAGCQIIAVATSHRPVELKPKTDNIIFDFTEASKFIR
jgi:beta-phosphoglucomutase